MQIADFRLTRFQFPRDRAIGDSQVRSEEMQCAALELIADDGTVGLGFGLSLFYPLPAVAEMERLFRLQIWPNLVGEHPATLANRIGRPRGGNRRPLPLPFDDTLQTALWDLAAKAAGLPLYKLLGAKRNRVRAYASGLDFHMSDDEFSAFF